MTKLVVTRDVTPTECDWLTSEIQAGVTVYSCRKATYGCIGSGVACTYDPRGGYPFFELPRDALRVVT